MEETGTRLARLNARIRNNPVVATLILAGTVVMAVSAFTDAARNLVGLVQGPARPDVNGIWQAEVVYDWPGARHLETFDLSGDDTTLHGTASFLGRPRGIQEGSVSGERVHFVTRNEEFRGADPTSRTAVHRYQGILVDDRIEFQMLTEGGYSHHVPIHFTARRAP